MCYEIVIKEPSRTTTLSALASYSALFEIESEDGTRCTLLAYVSDDATERFEAICQADPNVIEYRRKYP